MTVSASVSIGQVQVSGDCWSHVTRYGKHCRVNKHRLPCGQRFLSSMPSLPSDGYHPYIEVFTKTEDVEP